MIGALGLGLFCGIVAASLFPAIPSGTSAGQCPGLFARARPGRSQVGSLIFTVGFGIGDISIFDWGSVSSALIGTVIVLLIATLVTLVMRRPDAARLDIRRPPGLQETS